MISQNISRRVLGNVLNNISPSNIFPTMFLLERFYQNWQGIFGISGLRPTSMLLSPVNLAIFEGEMLIRTLSTTLLQIFCKIILISKVIIESIIDPDDIIDKNWRPTASLAILFPQLSHVPSPDEWRRLPLYFMTAPITARLLQSWSVLHSLHPSRDKESGGMSPLMSPTGLAHAYKIPTRERDSFHHVFLNDFGPSKA